MRVESNRTRGTFPQLRLALLRGLTCRLCSLYYKIEAVRSDIEVILLVSCIVDDEVLAGN
jgi:hypothetical protein